MITKLQDSSIEELSGGASAIEYPDVIPDDVVAMLINGPAGEHSPVF